jgi:Cof subfamily protein (haloacid dehalogenase superfamily)
LFRLIALDLDGTLLDDNKVISNENIIIINKLIQQGYKIIIATGRGYFSAKNLIKGIGNNLTILANNGNIIRNTSDDKTIYSRFMDKDNIKEILVEGEKLHLNPIIHVDYYKDGFDMITEENKNNESIDKYISKYINRCKVVNKEALYDLDRVLTLVYPGDRKTINEFYCLIKEKYPDKYSSHILNNIQVAEAMFEIMNPLSNKWISIMEYCKSIGIESREVIAIGDDNNDLDMISNAGLGIAMKNGSILVKESADIITDLDNNKSGVASILKEILDC